MKPSFKQLYKHFFPDFHQNNFYYNGEEVNGKFANFYEKNLLEEFKNFENIRKDFLSSFQRRLKQYGYLLILSVLLNILFNTWLYEYYNHFSAYVNGLLDSYKNWHDNSLPTYLQYVTPSNIIIWRVPKFFTLNLIVMSILLVRVFWPLVSFKHIFKLNIYDKIFQFYNPDFKYHPEYGISNTIFADMSLLPDFDIYKPYASMLLDKQKDYLEWSEIAFSLEEEGKYFWNKSNPKNIFRGLLITGNMDNKEVKPFICTVPIIASSVSEFNKPKNYNLDGVKLTEKDFGLNLYFENSASEEDKKIVREKILKLEKIIIKMREKLDILSNIHVNNDGMLSLLFGSKTSFYVENEFRKQYFINNHIQIEVRNNQFFVTIPTLKRLFQSILLFYDNPYEDDLYFMQIVIKFVNEFSIYFKGISLEDMGKGDNEKVLNEENIKLEEKGDLE